MASFVGVVIDVSPERARPRRTEHTMAVSTLAVAAASSTQHAASSRAGAVANRRSADFLCPPSHKPDCILAHLSRRSRKGPALKLGLQIAACAADPSSCGSKRAAREGLWLEFGVWRGTSTLTIADRIAAFADSVGPAPKVHAFDSFRGLPHDWRNASHRGAFAGFTRNFLAKGAFDRGGKTPFSHPNVQWEAGMFDATLPAFLARNSLNASFVHVDCDLYSSARTVLTNLQRRLAPQAVLVFDELINFPEFATNGEMRALLELQRATGRWVLVLGTSAHRVFTNAPFMRASMLHQKSVILGGGQDAALMLL